MYSVCTNFCGWLYIQVCGVDVDMDGEGSEMDIDLGCVCGDSVCGGSGDGEGHQEWTWMMVFRRGRHTHYHHQHQISTKYDPTVRLASWSTSARILWIEQWLDGKFRVLSCIFFCLQWWVHYVHRSTVLYPLFLLMDGNSNISVWISGLFYGVKAVSVHEYLLFKIALISLASGVLPSFELM